MHKDNFEYSFLYYLLDQHSEKNKASKEDRKIQVSLLSLSWTGLNRTGPMWSIQDFEEIQVVARILFEYEKRGNKEEKNENPEKSSLNSKKTRMIFMRQIEELRIGEIEDCDEDSEHLASFTKNQNNLQFLYVQRKFALTKQYQNFWDGEPEHEISFYTLSTRKKNTYE
ncbi:hypothetical protein RCL_jg13874.t1 [Rhizophagus clarus]|uniref:Uncharacterized protein n=1 Tax=Rhizophagus clarus TaxID=94130 RepID=A0A8H3LSE3_9GLOM|nr:hypothetical protein RCL_jg13874.t1 [Rhizophagus clarus]